MQPHHPARAHIDALADLAKRLRALRALPALLLRPDPAPNADLGVAALADALRRAQDDVRAARRAALAPAAQDALAAAHASERTDRTGVRAPMRRMKRRRSRTPESPREYPAFHARAPALFPAHTAPPRRLALRDVPGFVRAFNAAPGRRARLHVWRADGARAQGLAAPVVLRLLLPDVLTAFVTLGLPGGAGAEEGLVVENVTAFGAREKKLPHAQSDFGVFQKLSQQILRMVQAAPRVPVEELMHMLETYQSLFSAQCVVCSRVLSAEGYIPPVARVWRAQGAGPGVWEPQHVTCVKS
ncbi:hypothetical protein BV25DRAFT_1837624 [Artomyces pyxidatus]|uniref:Uncharacterized protein n=1 Tax=Artomyces pyxidatus TaxID=48021 RepID=A0ACB8T4M6_9AGAM|nr:hypothetical protein BV25DRAFT_1837624 [Artomyces pyxidatus]